MKPIFVKIGTGYLNVHNIESVVPTTTSELTKVQLISGDSFSFNRSVEEIMALIEIAVVEAAGDVRYRYE